MGVTDTSCRVFDNGRVDLLAGAAYVKPTVAKSTVRFDSRETTTRKRHNIKYGAFFVPVFPACDGCVWETARSAGSVVPVCQPACTRLPSTDSDRDGFQLNNGDRYMTTSNYRAPAQQSTVEFSTEIYDSIQLGITTVRALTVVITDSETRQIHTESNLDALVCLLIAELDRVEKLLEQRA